MSGVTRRHLVIILGLIVVVVAGVLGWPALLDRCMPDPPNGDDGGTPDPPAGPALVITGEHLGEIEPCGCTSPQLGGIIHRAAMLRGLADEERLLLDAGNLVARPGRQQELKYEGMIAAMNGMGYHAAALGPRDLQLGAEFLLRVAHGLAKFPLLAANLVDDARSPVLDAFFVRKFADREVAIVGLLPRDAKVPAGWRVTDPVRSLSALRSELDKVLGPEGRLIVLGTFGRPVAEKLASAAGRPALVVFGRGQLEPTRELLPGGPDGGVLFGVGGKGRYLGRLVLPAGWQSWSSGELLVPRVISDGKHPAMQALIERYQRQLKEEKIIDRVPRVASKRRLVGSKACKPCHEAEFRVWETTRHARAMKSLVDIAHDHDPECVTCHVTGLTVEGGYRSAAATPWQARVSCESCHGPGSDHVKTKTKETIERGSQATCRTCHTHEHDPRFDYGKRWARIKH